MAAAIEATGAGRDAPRGEAAVPGLVETVGALIGLMRQGGIVELDVSVGDVAIRLRGGAGIPAPIGPEPVVAVAAPPPVASADEHIIAAPMIGTFYTAAAPGEPPFVRAGDAVEVGQVVGIIEAMKIMNEIVADRAGVVEELLVANGQAVEYGSPLIRLSLGEGTGA